MTAKTAAPKAAEKTAPAADKAAETAAPEFVPSFEDVAVPAVTRTGKPNAYAEKIGSMAKDRDEDGRSKVAAVVVLPDGIVDAQIRLMQSAAKDNDTSLRSTKDSVGNGQTRVTFWLTNKIVRARSAKDETAAETAAETDSK